MNIKIITTPVNRDELREIAQEFYGDMIKGVVDVATLPPTTKYVDPVRWHSFSSLAQMGNIGSEVVRFLNASGIKKEQSRERMLELMNLTLEDREKSQSQKEEIRELQNILVSDERSTENKEAILEYCNAFGFAWALRQMAFH